MAAGLVDGDGDHPGRRPRRPRPSPTTPETVFAALVDGDRAGASGRGHRPVVCGVGCGGPMTAGGETGVAAQHRSVASISRCATGWPTELGLPVGGRQRRQGPGPGRGLAGCGPGRRRTIWPWWSRPASAAASCSTVGCSTARRATPGTSATWWSSPMGGPCVCGGRGCLEAEASGLSIAVDHRARRRRGARRRSAVGPAPWSAGRWPRWPICWISSWRWWPVRSPSASGPRSSTPPKRRSSCGRGWTSRGRPGSSRPGWAPPVPWWGRPPSGAGHWPRRGRRGRWSEAQ